MPTYLVNKSKQDTGEHELHTTYCPVSPGIENSIYLGHFSSCRSALKEARKHYVNVDGCVFCSQDCHTIFTHATGDTEFNFKKS